jgi:hypothetical protein
MWKLLIGFVLFAVLAVFVLMKGGADVDMSGEKHGLETSTESSTPETASAPQAASVGASK